MTLEGGVLNLSWYSDAWEHFIEISGRDFLFLVFNNRYALEKTCCFVSFSFLSCVCVHMCEFLWYCAWVQCVHLIVLTCRDIRLMSVFSF